MQTLVLVLHILAAAGIVVLVLLQHGKGADMGAAFGSGSSGSLFGATGSANFLSRTTAVLAAIFFLTSLTLAYLATNRPRADAGVMEKGVMDTVPPPAAPAQGGDASIPTPGAASKGTPPAPQGGSGAEKPGANDVPK
jgi:preprotein translocase subunit SecG